MFLTPHCSHCTLNFCCHITSSWRSTSSHQSFSLLSNFSNPGVACYVNFFWTLPSLFLNLSLRFLISPNTSLFHFLSLQVNSLIASCNGVPLLQFVSVNSMNWRCKCQAASNRKGLYPSDIALFDCVQRRIR